MKIEQTGGDYKLMWHLKHFEVGNGASEAIHEIT